MMTERRTTSSALDGDVWLGAAPPPKPPLGGPPPPTGPMVRMVGLMVVLTDGVEFLTFESVLSTPTAPFS
jgi:hypothetical protein